VFLVTFVVKIYLPSENLCGKIFVFFFVVLCELCERPSSSVFFLMPQLNTMRVLSGRRAVFVNFLRHSG